eukprot:SAG22_NODE_61_length_23387_cov_34.380582_13_plen_478_part_00
MSGTATLDTSSPRVLPPNWCPGLASWGTHRETHPLGDCCYCGAALAHALDAFVAQQIAASATASAGGAAAADGGKHRPPLRAQRGGGGSGGEASLPIQAGWLCSPLLARQHRAVLLSAGSPDHASLHALSLAMLCQIRHEVAGPRMVERARVCLYDALLQKPPAMAGAEAGGRQSLRVLDALATGWGEILNVTGVGLAGGQDRLGWTVSHVVKDRCCSEQQPLASTAHYWRRIQLHAGWRQQQQLGSWAQQLATDWLGGTVEQLLGEALAVPELPPPGLLKKAVARSGKQHWQDDAEVSDWLLQEGPATAGGSGGDGGGRAAAALRALALIGAEQGWDWAYTTLIIGTAPEGALPGGRMPTDPKSLPAGCTEEERAVADLARIVAGLRLIESLVAPTVASLRAAATATATAAAPPSQLPRSLEALGPLVSVIVNAVDDVDGGQQQQQQHQFPEAVRTVAADLLPLLTQPQQAVGDRS